jgi:phosphomannomutase
MAKEHIMAYPLSSEINLILVNPKFAIAILEVSYLNTTNVTVVTDAISLKFKYEKVDRVFNLHSNNTAPIVCLNVELKGNVDYINHKIQDVPTIFRS